MLLREILNTKYLTDEYANDLRYMIREFCRCYDSGVSFNISISDKRIANAINEALAAGKLELDIDDCRFTGKVWDAIASTKQRKDIVVITDSGDDTREQFIREYMDYVEVTNVLQRVRSLPGKPIDLPSLANWVAELDRDVVYYLIDEEYVKNPAFLLAIQLLAPDIKMEVNNKDLATYAKRVFGPYMVEECTSFYYIFGVQAEFLEAEVDEDGMVLVPNIGKYEKDVFVRKFICMPKFIGNSTVVYSKASANLKRAMSTVMQDVMAYLNERPTTIETYFPFKEVYQ